MGPTLVLLPQPQALQRVNDFQPSWTDPADSPAGWAIPTRCFQLQLSTQRKPSSLLRAQPTRLWVPPGAAEAPGVPRASPAPAAPSCCLPRHSQADERPLPPAQAPR